MVEEAPAEINDFDAAPTPVRWPFLKKGQVMPGQLSISRKPVRGNWNVLVIKMPFYKNI